MDLPRFLDFLQVSEHRKGATQIVPCSMLPSPCLLFPLWDWLGVRREDLGQGHARCQLTTRLGVSKKKSNVLVTLAFPFQFEYIKMQPSSCANPQAVEIKGF